ncbi:pirin family protein [Mesobacillus sp. AQ2]|uniref:pirin family protein n=1 Tax=Bacillaceae TaxID=186817 RepID=UPI00119D3180|nr:MULTISPECIES: pirin family protein [Bacillaceae]MCM3124674.1 pirin family protein [Mesobacillus sp. MER 33]MCM3234616.1 pirin family protein [Mesobacillus sp. MER 48]WHX41555.1 pirin family protein [Mesobacillus sp. AQ2]
MFKRDIKKHWTVQYEERVMPHVQAGMVLNPQDWRELDPFILMAEDWFKRGTFSDHPHRGFQTITFVIDGRLEHIDNHGGHSILEAGDIQYMNAGSGARHAEEAVENDIAHTLQLWLNLPGELKGTTTSYQNVYNEEAPVVPFDGGTLKVYSGETAGVKGPLEPLVPFALSEIRLSEGAEFTYELPETHNAFLYVLSGELEAGESKTNLKKSSAATLTYNDVGKGLSALSLKANKRSRVLVYSGQPIKEEVVAYGPFVMNSMEEIRQAYRDYQEGKFGGEAK